MELEHCNLNTHAHIKNTNCTYKEEECSYAIQLRNKCFTKEMISSLRLSYDKQFNYILYLNYNYILLSHWEIKELIWCREHKVK